jgi:hypothetical protein
MERSFPAIPLSIEVHIRAVLDLAAVAASLYTLGSRVKAEAAHVEAEICYTRLLVRLAKFDDGQTEWCQAMRHNVEEALRHIAKPDNGIPEKPTTAPSPSCEEAMFYTATSS